MWNSDIRTLMMENEFVCERLGSLNQLTQLSTQVDNYTVSLQDVCTKLLLSYQLHE